MEIWYDHLELPYIVNKGPQGHVGVLHEHVDNSGEEENSGARLGERQPSIMSLVVGQRKDNSTKLKLLILILICNSRIVCYNKGTQKNISELGLQLTMILVAN